MITLDITNNYKTFNFKENKTQILDFETLKVTHKENDVFGNPLKGLYHYQVIENVLNICNNSGLSYELEEIFAAQNKSSQHPGVSVLPQIEQIKGDNSVEAHILRRVFTTIKINDGENSEMNTTIAIAYHQDGVQIGFGPNVKICHNQCILSKERTAYNYGKEGVTNDEMFATVKNWLDNFFEYRENDLRIIEKMKQIRCSQNDAYQFIGLLTCLRVAKDSGNKDLSSNIKQYPLTQGQISQYSEEYLIRHLNGQASTLWDLYNIATELYKPEKAEIPNLLPQNVAMMELLKERFEL